jgi:hypothetical protein
MSGLYTKNNLRESGLNKTEAIQNLYAPGVQNDIRLFGFSNSVFSDLKPLELVNLPLVDSSEVLINRTKFVSKRFTFASGNKVWIDSVNNLFELDRRVESDLGTGSKVVFSKEGSLANVEILGVGSGYVVKDGNGTTIPGVSEVIVGVEGKQSGSKNALIKFAVNSDIGKIVRDYLPEVVDGGSGYIIGEELLILTQCQDDELSDTSKCLNYDTLSNRLWQIFFSPVAFSALVRASVYEYIVRDSDEEGFFLYNEREQKWVYLGSEYNTPVSLEQNVTLKRSDKLSVSHLLNIEKLEGASKFFNYNSAYSISGSLTARISKLVDDVSLIVDKLDSLYQDVKRQRFEDDPKNRIGTKINLYNSANINTTFRFIVRDPDGVLDLNEVDFLSLRDLLSGPDEIELELPSIQPEPLRIPGIWINVGGKYRRAFSSDDKPFQSVRQKNFLSPMIYRLADGETNYETGSLVERASTGENKYSLSASYLRFGGSEVYGFNTTISTLVQNLSGSTDPENGGIVYHSALTPATIRPGLQAWPLFQTTNSSFSILAV